jgi:ER membrane protein complex subunit 1
MMDELKEDPDKPAPIKLKLDAFPRYEPVIPIMWKRYLSYDLKLVGLQHAFTMTTKLESTSQVFTYGHDLFLALTTPDNGFDMLDEDFSFIGLALTIIIIIAFDIGLSKITKKRSVMKQFLTR